MGNPAENEKEIAVKTGALYAYIWDQFNRIQWTQFSDDHFMKWSPLPDSNIFKEKIVLDAGCGSGRACRSMLFQGAKKVVGIDMGKGCISNTNERNKDFSGRLEVKLASVLDVPYPDNTFDIVHCDEVLHHTTNPKKGFSELVRVLKPGGKIIIAVYGRGGFMNFAIYSARLFRRLIPLKWTFYLCKLISKNPVVWYSILDCMYVPIRENYYEHEIRRWFEDYNFDNIIRMDSAWGPYAYGRWMKGDGYIKFIADKRSN